MSTPTCFIRAPTKYSCSVAPSTTRLIDLPSEEWNVSASVEPNPDRAMNLLENLGPATSASHQCQGHNCLLLLPQYFDFQGEPPLLFADGLNICNLLALAEAALKQVTLCMVQLQPSLADGSQDFARVGQGSFKVAGMYQQDIKLSRMGCARLDTVLDQSSLPIVSVSHSDTPVFWSVNTYNPSVASAGLAPAMKTFCFSSRHRSLQQYTSEQTECESESMRQKGGPVVTGSMPGRTREMVEPVSTSARQGLPSRLTGVQPVCIGLGEGLEIGVVIPPLHHSAVASLQLADSGFWRRHWAVAGNVARLITPITAGKHPGPLQPDSGGWPVALCSDRWWTAT
ncbi:unnamed protein product [Pleuronectes platessa]|uniref:Uncharacterized protein n=1 Tax=Pleuronectes platessa TaxID=8262 RepID=A0A9N7U9H3_PLEPL|nr:unnamed protein product [Pleuronectes platessa]